MTVSKKKYHGVYVDDDIPAFMKSGPSKTIIHQAERNGILASSEYTLPLNINPSEHKPKTPPSQNTSVIAEPSLLWNHRFLLSMVFMLIGLNSLLYLVFSGVLNNSQSVRLTLTSTSQEVEHTETIEDRVMTFRDIDEQFKRNYEARRAEELIRAKRTIPPLEGRKPVLIKP